MEVNIKISRGTKKAHNKKRLDKVENNVINKIDWYKARKERRKKK